MTVAAKRGVAQHLGIAVADYDRAIRSFVPQYETMLDAVAGVLKTAAKRRAVVVDLGTGSGALAQRCLRALPQARVIGLDTDPAMLRIAAARLSSCAVDLRHGSFSAGPLPRADAIVASLSLHHIARARKAGFYRRVFQALSRGGLLVSADCYPPRTRSVAKPAMQRWRAHVRRCYSPRETSRLFRSWSQEDEYVPLETELALMAKAGFLVDVAWRWAPFAVLVGSK
jgi:SAM-dependent methyltransferase